MKFEKISMIKKFPACSMPTNTAAFPHSGVIAER